MPGQVVDLDAIDLDDPNAGIPELLRRPPNQAPPEPKSVGDRISLGDKLAQITLSRTQPVNAELPPGLSKDEEGNIRKLTPGQEIEENRLKSPEMTSAYRMRHDPGTVTNFFMGGVGGAIPGAEETVATGYENLAQGEAPLTGGPPAKRSWVGAATHGALKKGVGLVNPLAAGTAGALGPLESVAAPVFTAQMGLGAATGLKRAYEKGLTTPEGAEELGGAGVDALMFGMARKKAVESVKEGVTRLKGLRGGGAPVEAGTPPPAKPALELPDTGGEQAAPTAPRRPKPDFTFEVKGLDPANPEAVKRVVVKGANSGDHARNILNHEPEHWGLPAGTIVGKEPGKGVWANPPKPSQAAPSAPAKPATPPASAPAPPASVLDELLQIYKKKPTAPPTPSKAAAPPAETPVEAEQPPGGYSAEAAEGPEAERLTREIEKLRGQKGSEEQVAKLREQLDALARTQPTREGKFTPPPGTAETGLPPTERTKVTVSGLHEPTHYYHGETGAPREVIASEPVEGMYWKERSPETPGEGTHVPVRLDPAEAAKDSTVLKGEDGQPIGVVKLETTNPHTGEETISYGRSDYLTPYEGEPDVRLTAGRHETSKPHEMELDKIRAKGAKASEPPPVREEAAPTPYEPPPPKAKEVPLQRPATRLSTAARPGYFDSTAMNRGGTAEVPIKVRSIDQAGGTAQVEYMAEEEGHPAGRHPIYPSPGATPLGTKGEAAGTAPEHKAVMAASEPGRPRPGLTGVVTTIPLERLRTRSPEARDMMEGQSTREQAVPGVPKPPPEKTIAGQTQYEYRPELGTFKKQTYPSSRYSPDEEPVTGAPPPKGEAPQAGAPPQKPGGPAYHAEEAASARKPALTADDIENHLNEMARRSGASHQPYSVERTSDPDVTRINVVDRTGRKVTHITVNTNQAFIEIDPEKYEAGYGKPPTPGQMERGALGATEFRGGRLDRTAIVYLAEGAGKETLHWEMWRAAEELAGLTREERTLLRNVFGKPGDSEQVASTAVARAYSKWMPDWATEGGGIVQRIFSKVRRSAQAFADAFWPTKERAKQRVASQIFDDLRSGRIWDERQSTGGRLLRSLGIESDARARTEALRHGKAFTEYDPETGDVILRQPGGGEAAARSRELKNINQSYLDGEITKEQAQEQTAAIKAGKYPVVRIEGARLDKIRGTLSEEDISTLYDQIAKDPSLKGFEQDTLKEAVLKLRDVHDPLQPAEISALRRKFRGPVGRKIAAALEANQEIGRLQHAMRAAGMTNEFAKAVAASWDLSAPLRQGLVLTVAHPLRARHAIWDMYKGAFGSKGMADASNSWIKGQAHYDLATELGYKLQGEEGGEHIEQFSGGGAELAREIVPGVARSDRSYSAFLNRLRFDNITALFTRLSEAGLSPETPQGHAAFKTAVDYVNNATGQGSWKGISEGTALGKPARQLLAHIFWSPRFVESRLTLLNPMNLTTRGRFAAGGEGSWIRHFTEEPGERKGLMAPENVVLREHLANTAKLVGAMVGIVGLYNLQHQEETGKPGTDWNPTASDFMKMIIGPKDRWRADLLGGFQQYIRLAAQVSSGESKTGGGKIKQLGSYGAPTAVELLADAAAKKVTPAIRMILASWQGKDQKGEALSFPPSDPKTFYYSVRQLMLDSFLPMSPKDLVEIAQSLDKKEITPGQAAGLAALSIHGANVYRKSTPAEMKQGKFDRGPLEVLTGQPPPARPKMKKMAPGQSYLEWLNQLTKVKRATPEPGSPPPTR